MMQFSYFLLVISNEQHAYRSEYCQTDCMHSLSHSLYDTVSPNHMKIKCIDLKKHYQSKMKQTHTQRNVW